MARRSTSEVACDHVTSETRPDSARHQRGRVPDVEPGLEGQLLSMTFRSWIEGIPEHHACLNRAVDT